MNIFRIVLSFLICLGAMGQVVADDKVLQADYRPRPPEMVVAEGERISGPLKEILEEAAGKHGYQVVWRVVPFPRSLHDLETGEVDIVPRVIQSPERDAFVSFLGPIGYQDKDIQFLVRKGQEGRIKTYDDLMAMVVGVKLKTAYFEAFDKDTRIRKETAADDHNLARMFIGGRFETVALLDRSAMEGVLAGLGFKDYSFAEYRFRQQIGNFFGMSKKSPHADLFPALNETLRDMSLKGRVTELYKIHGVEAPLIHAVPSPGGT
ncbi:MAG: transporter substrate-binding domain-containing protein [Magnetococcales bacterium]|nr:transporter substrate-binding domain-containing protein [Magnetococcales bacterium]MBF0151237.1 transporter substrate-binding domain-containing protein [Magnetococcales bacterium]MBF0349031.1 transporter substrate-binding domain-containing protein [Magnetococcales bacterium]MBF0632198.1 transporter substrate-binding domain-containing protein [Magnetococcales bacterium]